MNTHFSDDPKLTAYALGELPEEERYALEATLDAAARQEIEDTRLFADALREALANEVAPDLTQEQKGAIPAVQPREPVPANVVPVHFRWQRALAWAACILFFGGTATMLIRQEAAKRDATFPQLIGGEGSAAVPRTEPPAASLDDESRATESSEGKADAAANRPGHATAGSPVQAQTAPRLAKDELHSDYKVSSKAISEPTTTSSVQGSSKAPVDSLVGVERPTLPRTKEKVAAQPFLSGNQIVSEQNVAGEAFGYSAGDRGRVVVAGAATPQFNTEAYNQIVENAFLRPKDSPLSTFSIDVDTGSYANVRRFLTGGNLPPKDSVRIEELLNYFDYQYAPPTGDVPFSVHVDLTDAPWAPNHKLARIGIKGKMVEDAQRPPANLVFLIDVSGSMDEPNKLPLVRNAMKLLVQRLRKADRVAIIVYAGASGMVIPSTEVSKTQEILAAIDGLTPGGSTNGAAGIQLAYDIAKANFVKEGINRVILCTDGDFNVGVTNDGDLVRLIEEKAKSGVFLTVLGFGMGNYKDGMLERLADKGNGSYGYIDTEREARKVLVEQATSTLMTIAKDVKIQVEFNPAMVGAYRLIGYENRALAAQDFNDDKKDAGEIGAGHTVTALYEIIPAGQEGNLPGVDPLRYRKPTQDSQATASEQAKDEWMNVKLRYKAPDGDTSKLIEQPVTQKNEVTKPEPDLQFAAAVAEFGMLLRDSQNKGNASWQSTLDLAENGARVDPNGYRHEFIDLVRKARDLSGGAEATR